MLIGRRRALRRLLDIGAWGVTGRNLLALLRLVVRRVGRKASRRRSLLVDHLGRLRRGCGRVVMLNDDAFLLWRRVLYDDRFRFFVLFVLVMLVMLSVFASVAAPDNQQDDNDGSCFNWETIK